MFSTPNDNSPASINFDQFSLKTVSLEVPGLNLPAVSPKVIKALMAFVAVEYTLNYELGVLKEQKKSLYESYVGITPDPPTPKPAGVPGVPGDSPAGSPTTAGEVPVSETEASESSNDIYVYGGAGIGALLLILLIVIIVLISRKPGYEKEERNTTSFNNPMYSEESSGNVVYNNPKATSKSSKKKIESNSNSNLGQLYDEPAFNEQSEKMNPVYGNEEQNEVKSGGYLDVEPDNEDDEATYVNENDDSDEEDDDE
jgi:hypothetical protein